MHKYNDKSLPEFFSYVEVIALNMSQNKFSLNRILPNKDRIYNSILIREIMSKRENIFWYILRSERIFQYTE